MTYPNLSDEEILKLRDAISNTLSNMKKDIRKDKLKVLEKHYWHSSSSQEESPCPFFSLIP